MTPRRPKEHRPPPRKSVKCTSCKWEGEVHAARKKCPKCSNKTLDHIHGFRITSEKGIDPTGAPKDLPSLKERMATAISLGPCFFYGCDKEAQATCRSQCGMSYCAEHMDSGLEASGSLCLMCKKGMHKWFARLAAELKELNERYGREK